MALDVRPVIAAITVAGHLALGQVVDISPPPGTGCGIIERIEPVELPPVAFEPVHVHFLTAHSVLSPAAQDWLGALANQLKSEPFRSVSVLGWADSTGAPQRNRRLARKRADAVARFLVSHGVPQDRIVVEGRGATSRFGSGISTEALAENRRVEVVVSPE